MPRPSRREAAGQLQLSLALVEANTDDEWRKDALSAIEHVCRNRDTFICDDIWGTGLRSTHNDKALGPLMMAAARNGWCRKTGRLQASKRSHLSGKPVWESLLRQARPIPSNPPV